jgi:formamidase
VRICVNLELPLADQPGTGHNRWHPDIEPIAFVEAGEELTLEVRDGADGQFTVASTAADISQLEFGRSHPLTGPIHVDGAMPGDVLEVEIVRHETAAFGFTPVVPGFGFLADQFPEPFLARWAIEGDQARSEEIPGVTIAGAVFAGVIGLAPSHELLALQLERERRLAEQGFAVAEPEPITAVPVVAAAGARTVPSRENGGNLDVRQLGAGSRLYLPIHVPGALFSVGDLHFAQGDGEVCGSAIEVSGAITLRLSVLKDVRPHPAFPSYRAVGGTSGPSFVTTGISVSERGDAEWMDVRLGARRALLALIDYLCEVRGLTREAAYVVTSVAAELRISQIVDVPHPLVSAAIPFAIFDD